MDNWDLRCLLQDLFCTKVRLCGEANRGHKRQLPWGSDSVPGLTKWCQPLASLGFLVSFSVMVLEVLLTSCPGPFSILIQTDFQETSLPQHCLVNMSRAEYYGPNCNSPQREWHPGKSGTHVQRLGSKRQFCSLKVCWRVQCHRAKGECGIRS